MKTLGNQNHVNPIQIECDKVLYTPKSKFHVDFMWFSQWLKHLSCPRQAMLLLQVLYFSHKADSIFCNGIGETYQGMLVNFNAIEERLGFSRKVCLTAFKKLEEQGLIARITLKNNRILYQATDKANMLLDDLHNYSLAANTDKSDYDKVSQNFDNISVSAASYTQRDRQAFTFGNSSIYKVNIKKVNNNQYNLSQELESVGATENFDCDLTVIFDFSEFGIGAVKCESSLFDYFTVNQAKAINTISHVNADKIDILAFNNALARKDIKREAQDFKQFVDWCYLVAVDAKGASAAKGSMTVTDADLTESVVASDLRNIGLKQSLTSKKIDNTNNASIVESYTATNKMTDQAHHNENVVKGVAESLNSNDGYNQSLRFGVASDAENALPNQSLTTMDIDNTDRLNVIAEDNANNEVVDQGNCVGNGEIVVDANGVNEIKNVIINGNDQARYSRETVANDNNYQQYISADNAAKDNEPIVDQYLNLGEYKYKDFVKLCVKRGFPSESDVVKSATHAIKTYGNLNFDQLYNGICYSHFTVPKLIDRQKVSEIEREHTKAQANNKAKSPLSKNTNLKLPTLNDLKMPVVEKEVLYKDWASLAQQDLVKDTVTECQKIALVAVIDYVKRKGVVITSDHEVYQWLYHTAANYEYYFSGATSFKHLANILIKRLVNQSFNRPSGFDHWYRLIYQKSQDKLAGSFSSVLKKNHNNHYMRH